MDLFFLREEKRKIMQSSAFHSRKRNTLRNTPGVLIKCCRDRLTVFFIFYKNSQDRNQTRKSSRREYKPLSFLFVREIFRTRNLAFEKFPRFINLANFLISSIYSQLVYRICQRSRLEETNSRLRIFLFFALDVYYKRPFFFLFVVLTSTKITRPIFLFSYFCVIVSSIFLAIIFEY